jgi:hypothetical protein
MKTIANTRKIVTALLLICFLVVTTVTPVKADDFMNATTLELNSGKLSAKTTKVETVYYKIVLPSDGYLKIQVMPEYNVACSFTNADFTKTYFSTSYKKNYYLNLDSGEYESLGSYFNAGTYYYAIKGENSYGNFVITADFTPVDHNDVEPNQTFDQAMPLTSDLGKIKGFISEDDEVDIYKINIKKDQTFVIKPLDYDQLAVNWLNSYSIYDSNFNKIETPYTLYRPAIFQWSEGTYYIKVVRDNYSSTNPQGVYGFEYNIINNNVNKVQYAYFENQWPSTYVNASITVKPTVLPASATNQKFTWKSSDAKIATVSADGKVTGKKWGNVTITATNKDNPSQSFSYRLTVQSISLTFDKYSVGLKVGKKYPLKPKTVEGASKTVTYRSLNTKIAIVSKTGTVTAKKKGTTKIKVQANGLTKYITIKVTK